MYKFIRAAILLIPLIANASKPVYSLKAISVWMSNGQTIDRYADIEILGDPVAYNPAPLVNIFRNGIKYIAIRGDFENTSKIVNWVHKENHPNLNICTNQPCKINTKGRDGINAFPTGWPLNDVTPSKLQVASVVNLMINFYGQNGVPYGSIQTYKCDNVTIAHGGKRWWIFNNYPAGFIVNAYLTVQPHSILCKNSEGAYNVLQLDTANTEVLYLTPIIKDYM